MRLRSQMVTRVGLLLTAFAVVVLLIETLGREIRHMLGAVVNTHLPLAERVENVLDQTDTYEMVLLRELTSDGIPSETRARLTGIGAAIRSDLDSLEHLLDEALEDTRSDVSERLVLARARGTLDLSRYVLDEYLDAGMHAVDVWEREGVEAARRAASELAEADRKIDPAFAQERRSVFDRVGRGIERIHEHLRMLSMTSLVLFSAAACLALWGVFRLGDRLARRVRGLHAAVESVARGELDVALPKPAPDEIGDLTVGISGMVSVMRREARTAETFGRFLDPRIAERLAAEADGEHEYAERRSATMLFADIAGFSGISELLTAETLVRLLNRVFTEAATAIQCRAGVVDKYIGDAVMAFFAPPFAPGDGHAAAACLAALDHLAALERIAPELADLVGLRRGAPRIAMRVGIATGPVVMGTVGSPTARSFTVIGDAVNAASRLTGVNRHYGTAIAIADDTRRLAASAVEARELDTVIVSGKSEPVTVHELLAPAGQLPAEDAERVERYAKALAAYRARDFAAAAAGFAECLRLCAADGPAKAMAERARQLAEAPPPEDWDGVWVLGGK